jgi:hypothetical protein
METEYCNICCDKFNRSNRIKLNCYYCNYLACRNCCEKYILSQLIPKCINNDCGKEWSRKFLRENFTARFLNTKYKSHLENILFNREISLMPTTQPLVEEIHRKRKIRKELSELDKMIYDLQVKKKELEKTLHKQNDEKIKEINFVKSCPYDGCKGFLNKDWKCGLCDNITCKTCHELIGIYDENSKEEDHICKPENIETAKLINKDSKPCPKCHSLIFKIDGCDQIWCTQCHTAFDWKTGKLENIIHNPHYYEWQRKNGTLERVEGDIECGRELNQFTIQRIHKSIIDNQHTDLYKIMKKSKYNQNLKRLNPYKNDINDEIEYYMWDNCINRLEYSIRQCVHNNRVEMDRFRTDNINVNQNLRIKYLLNELNENQFKNLIQKNDKKNKKNNEIYQVFDLCNTILTDIIYRCIDDLKNTMFNKNNIRKFMGELDGLIEYCNNLFSDISITYTCTLYKFSNTMAFISIDRIKRIKKMNFDSENENVTDNEDEYKDEYKN